MYEQDQRIVLTLDAGGTNFVFSAIQGCVEVVEPIRLAAVPDNMERCLADILPGGKARKQMLDDYQEIERALGCEDASKRAATEMIKLLRK